MPCSFLLEMAALAAVHSARDPGPGFPANGLVVDVALEEIPTVPANGVKQTGF
jgi:hypothetical protein